ncbi:MAG: hypothetical protein COA45_01355 [Zetaproteobacteria bacterium]|nr:MAG: hypothetical protein COA45_01355 [Zetaproteobacteria bacterium]
MTDKPDKDVYAKRLVTLLDDSDITQEYDVTYKSVFGAIGGYINQTIFISSGRFGIALKLPADILDDLMANHGATPFKYFEKGHIKKDYAVLPDTLLSDQPRMKVLLRQSIEFSV